MFGTTYPIFGLEATVSEGIRDRALADYIRWEFRPADRARVIAALGGSPVVDRRRPRLIRRVRTWLKAGRTREKERVARNPPASGASFPPFRTLESGLLYRAFPKR